MVSAPFIIGLLLKKKPRFYPYGIYEIIWFVQYEFTATRFLIILLQRN